MKSLHVLLASAMAAVLLAGCNGDNGSGTTPLAPPPTTSPGSTATVTDFTVFVQQLLASTAENTSPVTLDTIIFDNQLSEGDPQAITVFRP